MSLSPSSFPTDQSGVLHEVLQSGPELEEDSIQEAERGLRSQNQRRNKVRRFNSSFPLGCQNFWIHAYKPFSPLLKHIECTNAERTGFILNLGDVSLSRRERSKVPYIVRQCIEEVEKRGIEEVGIYRISGVATDIQALKAAFDTSKSPA